ncbi:MAG: hypothetical protein QOI93_5770 [Rhodospirillaceae bacterium]|nr:hypothetical protein [Rhodospirillaceae bacterium]
MPSIKQFDITLSDINFLLDQMREVITIQNYDSQGRPIYGYIDSTGDSHVLGLFGTFDPLSITDPVTHLSIYDGAREASGFRIPTGFFNNLVDLTRWSWGAVNDPFPRLTQADYNHYVLQVLSNPALTNGAGTGYIDVHPTVTDPNAPTTVATPAAYADLNKTVVDYTPRMITQTISSSYGAPGIATATGVAATAGSDAMPLMSPGELLIVSTGSGLVAFQFYDGASTIDPSTGNLVGIDVRAGVTVAAALLAIQAGLQNAGGAAGATVGLDGAGHISVALGSAQDGSLTIFDYAGLGLGGTFAPLVDNSSSALIRTGVYTDVFTSSNVIDGVNADGTLHHTDITEHVSRNLNTLPGDPSMSGIFTLFGQFFDHGLDFIDKGGQGAKVIIPLAPTDPLYGAIGPDGQPTTTITISRATPDGYTVTDLHGRQLSIAGADKTWGTADDLNGTGADGVYGTADDTHGAMVKPAATSYTDHTSPYIDQSQSYGSDTQITRLLREWVQDPNTGAWRPGAELLDGHHTQAYHSQVFHDVSSDSNPTAPDAGMTTRTVPTLAELRAHLLATGRADLSWDDINNFRARDDSSHVIDTNGASAGGYVYTGQAILLDMNPNFGLIDWAKVTAISSDVTAATLANFIDFSNFSIKNEVSGNPVTAQQYAAVGEALMESVSAHYIVGDGRGNENFGLTAMHHVFHENHNVQLVNLENMILSSPDVAARHGYQLAVSDGNSGFYTDASGNYTLSDHTTISWDPDKMFEATKLINEMEYQHVAIDQYARLVTPDLPEFVTYDNDINANISLEYAQAAFRFGHSQLRETIDAIDPNGTVTKWALSAAFLNPGAYAATGAENILRGMSQQLGNDVDEFLTPALQQSLLGQPLDLGAINIARARDLGIPTLNEVRRQLHDALVAERAADPSTPHHTNLIVDALNPYTSWAEFGSQMQHPDSLVNFIAAYSFDGDLAKAQEIMDLESGTIVSGSGANHWTTQYAVNFLNGADDGYNKIDFWIGGLAELHVFTGQVGTTFNAIFEDQMERLMDGDRFYYLYRLGLALNIDSDLGHMVVTEQFKDIIERTTGAMHLNGDVMGYADHTFELAPMYTADLAAHAGAANGFTLDAHGVATATSTTMGYGIYSGSGNGIAGNGSLLTKTNTDLGLSNTYIADFRPDTGANPDGTPASGYNSHEVFSGTDFNDWLDAGNGDDTIYGDKGNDVLDGKAGADHIYGGDGQDVIYGGDIEDFLDGGAGDDIVYGGTSAGALDVVIGGAGNDKLYGEAGIDEIYGGAGDDYIDAGGDTDLAFGDSGNDIMYGGDGPDELRGGTGDDILSGGSGSDQLKGEQGDDIFLGGIGQAAQVGDADEALGDVGFDMTSFSDVSIVLDTAADLRNLNLTAANGGTPFEPFNQLWADIEGVIGSKFDDTLVGADTGAVAADGVTQPGDNWLVGGGGNDTFGTRIANADGITGSGGNDVIIGDSIRLDTLIGKYAGYTNGFDANGNATHGYIGPLSDGLLANAALGTAMFAKHYTDLLKTEARKDFVLGDDVGTPGAADTAVFTGNRSEYTVERIQFASAGEGVVTAFKVTHNNNGADGVDLVIGVEKFQFADATFTQEGLFDVRPEGTVAFAVTENPAGVTNSSNAVRLTGASSLTDADNISAGNPTGAVMADITYSWLTTGNAPISTLNSANPYVDASGRLVVHTTSGTIVREKATYTDAHGNATTVTTDWNMVVGTSGNNNPLNGTNSLTVGDAIFGLSGNDTLNGLDGADRLYGGAGNDTLNGGAGNDFLDGSTGADAMTGGDGDDIYVVDDVTGTGTSRDQITEAPSGGIDTVAGDVNLTLANYANVENITLTGTGNDTATGNIGDNVITGNAGNNTLDAGTGGTDTLIGGAGNDTYVVNHAGVTITENAGEGTDTVRTTMGTYSLAAFAYVENLTFVGSGSFTGAGNALNNVITGGASGDTLTGAAGDDTINGAGGGSDTAVFSGGIGNFSLSATTGNIIATDHTGAEGIDTLTSIEQLRFNGVNYTVVLGTNGNNTNLNGASGTGGSQAIFGLDGNDAINGGAGDDYVNGGSGNDTITQAAATGGRDIVDGGSNTATGDRYVVNGDSSSETFAIYSNTDDWDNNAANGIVSSAAHAGFTGLTASTEIVIARNGTIIAELDNIEEITVNTFNVSANDGNGVPNGGTSGGDTIQVVGNFTGTSLNYSTITVNGGDGNDSVDISQLTSDHRIVFHGGGGNNLVIGDIRFQDVVDNQTPPTGGDPGSDPQHPGDGSDDDTVVAHIGTPADDVLIGGAADDILSGVNGNDLMLGNGGADTLKGDDGDDLIKGGAGDDVAFGNAGNDDVFGGAGQDMLFGDQGNDRLFGDDGNDVMEGSAGNDTVYAGPGDDRVLAKVDDGDDIYWGEDGRDTVDYSAITANLKADLGNGLLQHGSVVSTQSGNDTIFGFENFIGGSGDDTIVASAAANVMDGGPGSDNFVFNSAADANGDVIKGFQPGDKIDLSGIDANTGASGKQSFVLFAGTGFTAAGQLMVTHEVQDGVDHTIFAGNINNDSVADFKIDVVGNQALTASDFHGVN